MATAPEYTVLPVSALKDQATTVFDALADGKIVYVSKRGRIEAAFLPYPFVPERVAALHASPNFNLGFTVTARDMGQAVPSAAVSAAAAGLPSIVEKGGRIYGILTPADAPQPVTIPDPDKVGARAEAILDYQKNHPSASIDEIEMFAENRERPDENVAAAQSWRLADLPVAPFELEREDAIADDLKVWRNQGSRVEDTVARVFEKLDEAVAAIAKGAAPVVVPNMAEVARDSLLPDAVDSTVRESLLRGEKFEAAGDLVAARTRYVTALAAQRHPNVGVMWRLGILARSEDHPAEAARWFRLSLVFDALGEALEQFGVGDQLTEHVH